MMPVFSHPNFFFKLTIIAVMIGIFCGVGGITFAQNTPEDVFENLMGEIRNEVN